MKHWPDVSQVPDPALSGASNPVDLILQRVIDAMASYVAVLDGQGAILLVNQSWRQGMHTHQLDYADDGVGTTFESMLLKENPSDIAKEMVAGLNSVIAGSAEPFRFGYEYDSLVGAEHLAMTCSRLDLQGAIRILVTYEDITLVVRAQEERRLGAIRLLEMQSTERRHIARELHDSLSQQLIAIQMLSGQLGDEVKGARARRLLSETRKATDEAIRAVRTLSFALHPPGDDEQIVEGLRHFLRGFSSRTGLPVTFAATIAQPRALEPLQIALFRITQEALTNAHRHSDASRVSVRLVEAPGEVMLRIADNGRGFDAERIRAEGIEGVGIPSMRERAQELGGTLTFEPTRKGTTLIARLPL